MPHKLWHSLLICRILIDYYIIILEPVQKEVKHILWLLDSEAENRYIHEL